MGKRDNYARRAPRVYSLIATAGYFLGIDIGTFESRGILIDESFRVAADASVPHGMNNPQPGWFEQEAETVWWGDLCKLCRTLIKQSGIRPEQIACVGTSALGTDCLPDPLAAAA